MMINIPELVELAEKAHIADVEGTPHDARNCRTCISIANAQSTIDTAESIGGDVVLYIP